MDEKNEIPKHWSLKTLGEVCIKIGDIDHKMPKEVSSGYAYVSTKDFTDDLKISFDKAKYISEEDYLNLSRKIKPEKGDIIFPRYGTIGKNILIDFDKKFLVSYSCAVIKPNRDLVLSKFVYLYTLSPRVAGEIRKYTVETTQANVGIASIKSFVFPLPPLSEQQAIVSKIEELLSDVENGKQQLLTAREQLKVYRQSLLKWAFEGRLTEEWRKQNPQVRIQSGSEKNETTLKMHGSRVLIPTELERGEVESGFEPQLEVGSKTAKSKAKKVADKKTVKQITEVPEARFELGELPDGWVWVKLESVTTKITDGEHFKPQTQATGVPFLSAKDVRDDGVSFEAPLFISEEIAAKAMLRCKPEKGDILIVSRGATVGRMCIVNTDKKFCLLGSVILIKAGESVNNKFLNYVLKSPHANQKLVSASGATAQQAIYLRDIKAISVPLPGLIEQKEIVDELERKLTVCDKMEENIESSLQQAETLKQSILKRAFEGRLV